MRKFAFATLAALASATPSPIRLSARGDRWTTDAARGWRRQTLSSAIPILTQNLARHELH